MVVLRLLIVVCCLHLFWIVVSVNSVVVSFILMNLSFVILLLGCDSYDFCLVWVIVLFRLARLVVLGVGSVSSLRVCLVCVFRWWLFDLWFCFDLVVLAIVWLAWLFVICLLRHSVVAVLSLIWLWRDCLSVGLCYGWAVSAVCYLFNSVVIIRLICVLFCLKSWVVITLTCFLW